MLSGFKSLKNRKQGERWKQLVSEALHCAYKKNLISQEKATPVCYSLSVKMLQPADELRCVKDGSRLVEAGLAHVIEMELEVASIHQG